MTSGGAQEPDPADVPPFLPPHWRAEPAPAAGGSQALLLRERSARRLAAGVGIGVLAIALGAWTAALALNDQASQDRPWIWIMGAASAGGALMAVRRARISAAWQLTPGCLLVGEIRGRGGRWVRPPDRVVALEVTLWSTDDSEHHRLSAVLPSRHRVTMFDGRPDDDSVQTLASWLATRADVPFTDLVGGRQSRTPGDRTGEGDDTRRDLA